MTLAESTVQVWS